MKFLHLAIVAVLPLNLAPLWAAESSVTDISEPLDIYLLIGQSNMAGRAELSKPESAAVAGCYLMNSKGQWEPATNPLNRYSTIRKGLGKQKLGPGSAFAVAIRDAHPDTALGLVVNAKGGTKIEQWQKGTNFYNQALERTRAAMKSGTLKGILWHQGESDAKAPEGYAEKLQQLVRDIRDDLGSPELPFVAGEVGNSEAINQQIRKLPSKVPGTAVVSAEGLTLFDKAHFDQRSANLLGKRYAEEMLKLQTQ